MMGEICEIWVNFFSIFKFSIPPLFHYQSTRNKKGRLVNKLRKGFVCFFTFAELEIKLRKNYNTSALFNKNTIKMF